MELVILISALVASLTVIAELASHFGTDCMDNFWSHEARVAVCGFDREQQAMARDSRQFG